jgi:hypothetical protein
VAPDGRRVGSLKRRVHAEPFGEMRDEKSARCCGAKHISKSKCQKHLRLGALLEVEMFKKGAPVWCKAHVEVKSRRNWRSRTTFGRSDVEKVNTNTLTHTNTGTSTRTNYNCNCNHSYNYKFYKTLQQQSELQYNYNCNYTTITITATASITTTQRYTNLCYTCYSTLATVY